PVNACPLVQPRARTAPTPMIAPPAHAIARRERTVTPVPRSTPRRSLPASAADRNPPIATPTISISSHSRHGPPGRARQRPKYGFDPAYAGATAATVPEAVAANAPDAPSPRPANTNAASSTSPRATPERYGSEYFTVFLLPSVFSLLLFWVLQRQIPVVP